MKWIPALCLGILLLVGCGAAVLVEGAHGGDVEGVGEGVAGVSAADILSLRKAAEQGDVEAQNNLGYRHEYGDGVAKDATEAVKWYRKAAEQGHARAQFNLGACYAGSKGVAKDDVIAYMWFNLAAASGDEDGKNGREVLEKRMPRNQIAEAQRLSRDWKRRGE